MKNAKIAKQRQKKTKRSLRKDESNLRFTPTAWAKLIYLRDLGPTEVGGFGISSAKDLLLVEDVLLVQQTCDWASVKFDDESVADFFDNQVDAGRRPEEFGRIWIHTHPGASALPSWTDEATFERVFGSNPWAVMFILARGGNSYARLRFNVGPSGAQQLPAEVDYSTSFGACDQISWKTEYEQCVLPQSTSQPDEQNLPLKRGSDPFEVGDELSWWEAEFEPWSWHSLGEEVNCES